MTGPSTNPCVHKWGDCPLHGRSRRRHECFLDEDHGPYHVCVCGRRDERSDEAA